MKPYAPLEMEVIQFEAEDAITASADAYEYETEIDYYRYP